MSQSKFLYWLAVEESKPVRFSELAHMLAMAMHPKDDWGYAAARVNFEAELPKAVHNGELVVRNPLDMGHHTFPYGDALQRSVLLPHDLRPFLEARSIDLRLIPHGSGPTYWTLENAALAIAEQEGWTAAATGTLLDQLLEAANAGSLVVRDPHTTLPKTSSEVRPFYELVTARDVNRWFESTGVEYRWGLSGQDETHLQAQFELVMFAKFRPRVPWKGGLLTDTDVVNLQQAARFATRQAGQDVTADDFLRAAARGQIALRAIVHRSASTRPCRPGDEPLNGGNPIPKHSIPTLPVAACRGLANVGHATWRVIEAETEIDGAPHRYARWELDPAEPDFETTVDDCRVTGSDVHALADAVSQVDEPPSVGDQGQMHAEQPSYDLAMLATRDQLISAFGVFTGMDKSWFKSLDDVPMLKVARKVVGRGQRGATIEPLFCPFEVMQWLISPSRKKGRRLGENKGWELLEKHFPRVYATKSPADPR